MRRLFTSLSVIVAAMVAFSGCTKEEIKNPVSETKTVQFVAESIETKTAFGTPDGTTYPTLWTENDKQVKLLLNLNEEFVADLQVANDFTSASFSTEVKIDGSLPPYQFCAISPSLAFLGMNEERFAVTIPTSQTPLENSVDESAQILYALSEPSDELPETVTLHFKHFTAYGKLSFVNLNLGDAKVTSVAITSSVDLANRWNCFVADESFGENSGASTITLNTSATENLWFACAPVGDMNEQTLTFTVNTDKGPLSKTVTLGEKHKFEAGKIANMKVDMTDIEFAKSKIYERVTDVSDLTVDSEIILVASEDNYALSTTQNSNNRGQAAVTKSGDKSTITDPGNDVQVITIEDGTKDGTIAFNVGNGYLYAASSGSNYLRTETNKSDNSSWSVTIENGIATVKAQGANTRNWLRYNSTNKMFSCYGSDQNDISIYKLQGSGTVLENYLRVSKENIEVEADATLASFTVNSDLDWTATSEDADVTNDDKTVTVTFPANEEAEEQVYIVTVSADGVEPVTVTITQKGYVDTSVIEELTVAEFKNKEVSTEVWYKLTGTISNIYNTQYGNFYLTDEADDQITVYGLKENESASKDSFANLGLKEGDSVTLIGNVGEYNSNKQVVNAYHVSSEKLAAWDAPSISVAKNKVTITTAETGVKVYYTVDGNTPTESSTLYTDAFDITATVTVKAIAVADGRPNSSVSEKECEYVEQTGSEQGGGRADFETVTNTSTSYSSATTTAGWTATNCAVLKGGTSNSNPAFTMIGDVSNRAFCMNGKTSAVGTITSPTLTDGCGTLSFSYGLPYSDTKIKFKVDIMQNETVVKTFTVNPSSVAKQTAYTCEEAINVSGDFQIVFTNLSPSNSTSNKDRTAIWDVEWTGYSD